jgi:Xaa-Pro aminopeptidase
MDSKEYQIRLSHIRKAFQEAGADACLISTHVNIFYLTGQIFSGYIYLSGNEDPLWLVRRPAGLEGPRVRYIRKVEQLPSMLQEEGLPAPGTLLLEGEEMGIDAWMRIQKALPATRLLNGSHALRVARSVKTDEEIALIRQSAEAHAGVYRLIPGIYKPGMTDRDLAVELDCLMLRHGNLGLFRAFGDMDAFMGTVLAGDNAAVPSPYDFALGGAGVPSNPVGASGLTLQRGMSVMVDLSGNFTGYLDDMSRTFSIGKLTDEAYRAHQVSIDISNRLQEELVPGAVCEDLYATALKMAEDAGLGHCFMGTRQQAKFVGHGVGLVINEWPVLARHMSNRLEANMVVAVEPKFVIEGTGAVGVENTYVVREGQGEKITLAEERILDLEP